MEFIGDLERAFATSLYPLRVPIFFGLVIAFVVFVWYARRRGWFAAARRHPGRTSAMVLVLLVVGLPVSWYFASPLWIRTTLDEPLPSVTATSAPTSVAVVPTAPPVTGEPPTSPPTLAPSVAPPVLSATRTGEFKGEDEFHFGSGTASLIETEPGTFVVRFENFSVRNGPDLFVYLSPDPGGYEGDVLELGSLKATDGNFNYTVPAGMNIASYQSVVIWCKQFAVQFAVARLH